MPAYGIAITEQDLDLLQFLNDGVRPEIKEEFEYFVFEIKSPREITSKIVTEAELKGKSVHTLLFHG